MEAYIGILQNAELHTFPVACKSYKWILVSITNIVIPVNAPEYRRRRRKYFPFCLSG